MEEQPHIWNLITRKLSGEATAEEQQELAAFLRAHPEQQYRFEMLADWWSYQAASRKGDRGALHFEQLVQKLVRPEEPEQSAAVRPQFKRWQKWSAVAAIVLLIGWAAFVYLQKNKRRVSGDNPDMLSQISTRYGSKSYTVLPDGSQVWLNAGSKLTYKKALFGVSDRIVTLAGEAYFNVVHNAHIPFVVHAGSLHVKVLGTTFDIKSYPGDSTAQATLIQGAIAVSLSSRSNQAIRMKPRQTLTVFKINSSHDPLAAPTRQKTGAQRYRIAPLTRLPDDSTIVETSWVEDKLAFCNESFAALAPKMERWYNVHIIFNDTAVKKYQFTGFFMSESMEQALKTLKLSTPFAYRITGDEVVISKHKVE